MTTTTELVLINMALETMDSLPPAIAECMDFEKLKNKFATPFDKEFSCTVEEVLEVIHTFAKGEKIDLPTESQKRPEEVYDLVSPHAKNVVYGVYTSFDNKNCDIFESVADCDDDNRASDTVYDLFIEKYNESLNDSLTKAAR
jgi:hypothetical protein